MTELLHDVEPRDPAPLTPEERYDEASHLPWFGKEAAEKVAALRDMIASLDAEQGRASETMNAFQRQLEGVHLMVNRRLSALESPAPDTVAVPASLVAALVKWRDTYWADPANEHLTARGALLREYDAWKAGQE